MKGTTRRRFNVKFQRFTYMRASQVQARIRALTMCETPCLFVVSYTNASSLSTFGVLPPTQASPLSALLSLLSLLYHYPLSMKHLQSQISHFEGCKCALLSRHIYDPFGDEKAFNISISGCPSIYITHVSYH